MSFVFSHLSEAHGEVEVEWNITNIGLSDKVGDCYDSPTFYFAGSSWYLRTAVDISLKKDEKSNYIALFIKRKDSGPLISIKYNMKLLVNNVKQKEFSSTEVFEKENGFGHRNVILISDLLKMTLDVVIIRCLLNYDGRKKVETSIYQIHQTVCDNLGGLYLNEKWSDVELHVEGKKLHAHKMILAARSSVFSAMFDHDMAENLTNEVNIEDIDLESFKCVLRFMYCGEIDVISTENALTIYAAADKYALKDLKKLCLEYAEKKLTIEWVLDVVKFADFYNETETGEAARKFFRENAIEILETDHWKTFSEENHKMSMDLIVSAFRELSLSTNRTTMHELDDTSSDD